MFLVAFALLAAAEPAGAGAVPAQSAPAAAPVAAAPVKEKKVCRSEEVTGSIMPKRVCRTQAEWTAYNAQINAHVRDQQRTLPSASGR